MSWWTKLRDAVEHSVLTAAKAAAHAAAPEVATLAKNAGAAVLAAVAADGIKHGSQEAIGVALNSIKADAPHLRLTLSTALAASVADELHEESEQKQDDPGPPPETASQK